MADVFLKEKIKMLTASNNERVAFFLPSLQGGGAERVTVNLARGFLAKGFPVDLVLAKAEGPYLKETPKDCRVFNLGAHRVAAALFRLTGYLRQIKPRVMISGLNYANVISIAAGLLARVPTKTIIVEHSTLSSETANAKSRRDRYIPYFMRIAYPKANEIIAVSQGVADDLCHVLGLAKTKVRVIYNPIVDNEILTKAREPVNHPWLQDGTIPVVLSVGRLNKAKDFSTLMRAFVQVRRILNCHLVILGEGEERKTLERLAGELGIEKDLWMPGFMDNPFRFMIRADVFVLSSIWEGFSAVIVEALACGTRVVSTDCPSGPREILENGKWGELVPVSDPQALAEAVARALNTPADKERLKLQAQKFTIDKITDKYLEII